MLGCLFSKYKIAGNESIPYSAANSASSVLTNLTPTESASSSICSNCLIASSQASQSAVSKNKKEI